MSPLCPGCRSLTSEDSAFYPFCSERCRLVDLGAWLNADYRVPEDSRQSVPISVEGAPSSDS
ncbi:MAG: DNA gyrase inhibitor YacG [Nitrospira sp. SB0662_bin_26]|nr:DNA gyrase inhibitor YacG [Nitrospira sp. SB0662_bin_26]